MGTDLTISCGGVGRRAQDKARRGEQTRLLDPEDGREFLEAAVDGPEKAAEFFETALRHGHEGIMAKSTAAPYAAGGRGQSWLKVKKPRTLDLVILAAEWGNGRRRGWLSNLHLGARDTEKGGLIRAQAYSADGNLLKEFEIKNIKRVEGRWQLKAVGIRNEQTDTNTRLEFDLEIKD